MWDERYGQPGFAYGDEPNDFLVEVVGSIPPGPVLCLAEGEGRNAAYLASRGHAVTAVDQSAVGLAKARRLAEQRGTTIETVVADLADYVPSPGHWSAIISIWAHVPSAVRRPLHERCVRGLRPGGVLILEAYSPDQIGRGTGGPPDEDRTMSAAGLREELAGLELLRCEERERHISEGRYHQGMSAVVQVLARAPGS